MYRQMTLLFGAALLGLAHAQQPQITAAPGKMAKRQDHIENIEIHQDYAAPIGVDTDYLTMEGSTTKVNHSGTLMILNPLRYLHSTRLTGRLTVDRR